MNLAQAEAKIESLVADIDRVTDKLMEEREATDNAMRHAKRALEMLETFRGRSNDVSEARDSLRDCVACLESRFSTPAEPGKE